MASKGQATETLHTTQSCLVIEDDAAVREAFNLALAKDYTLHFAEDGGTALRSLGRYPIDLVILDLRLPDLHGIEVLRHIRRLTPTCL